MDSRCSKTTCSQLVILALALGCVSGLFLKLLTLVFVAFIIVSGFRKELENFSFSDIDLINSELYLFFPCLTCNPFNARL